MPLVLLTFNMQGNSPKSTVWTTAAENGVNVVALQEAGKIETDGPWVAAAEHKVACAYYSVPPAGVTAVTGSLTYTPGGAATRAAQAGAGKRFAYVHVNWADPKRVADLGASAAAASAANPDLAQSDHKTRARTQLNATTAAQDKAASAGTHCNMGMAIAWDGATSVKFFVDRLGGEGTSDRPVLIAHMGTVAICNVHLTSGPSSRARAIELTALATLAARSGWKQWAVVGDFNQDPKATAAMLGGGTPVAPGASTHAGGGVYDYAVSFNAGLSVAQLVGALKSDHTAVSIA